MSDQLALFVEDRLYQDASIGCGTYDTEEYRAILRLYTGALFTQRCHPEHESNNGYVEAMDQVVRIIASRWYSHPDYRPEWAPVTTAR